MKKMIQNSAIDYCRHQKLNQLDYSVLQILPISSFPLPNGKHQVISYYSDDIWRLESTRFPSNDNKSGIFFKTIPSQFVSAIKFALKHYDIKENPKGGTLIGIFKYFRPFLNYLNDINVQSTASITPMHCANYVHKCKQSITKRSKKKLSTTSLGKRFLAVEVLYYHLKDTEWSFEHPWIESSASYLAGVTGQGKKKSKTEIIPDDELKILMGHCNKALEQAAELMELKSTIELKRASLAKAKKSQYQINYAINEGLLKPKGYDGARDFNVLYNDIPTKMGIIILTLTGIRNHELCAIQTDAYRIEDKESDIYYWLKTYSSKTHEGYAEWLVPELVIKAIEVQKTYIQSLRQKLWQEQAALLAKDPHDERGLKIESFKHHLFLTFSVKKNRVNSLTLRSFNHRLKTLGDALNIKELASHRFRRTFAVYVAQSAYGDLRYLKQHFKHWGMDMTLLYAANERQDEELYNEIAIEIKNFKIARIEEFLNDDTIITGGLANKLISYRSNSEPVKTFDSLAAMAEHISDTVHLRSTGHSWCTSDNAGCGGRSLIEATSCVKCPESIIEKKRHGAYFKRVYQQQIELRQIDDIGEAGMQRVERDIERCEQVLKGLDIWDEVKEK